MSLQMVLSLESAADAWAVLERISSLDPSSVTIAPCQVLKAVHCLKFKFLTTCFGVSSDALGVVCHQSGLFRTEINRCRVNIPQIVGIPVEHRDMLKL